MAGSPELAVLKVVGDYGPLSVEEAVSVISALLGMSREESLASLGELERRGLVRFESGLVYVTGEGRRLLIEILRGSRARGARTRL